MADFLPAPPNDHARLLPVYTHERELLDALKHHPVVIVEGPTGSGKTTQIPQMLLRAGIQGRIGMTQPRRIAAVSVAWRIAEEQNVAVGDEVGFAIRFDDRTGPKTRIKVMTDGILLQEAQRDRMLSDYDVIIIDEAHERSLNIDFALGLLHGLLRIRHDLRVVVSSATLQPETFIRFFGDLGEDVPVVRIDARPHPVEIVWRPTERTGPEDLPEAVAREVAQIHRSREPGHVLCFMPGEDAIKRTAAAIARHLPANRSGEREVAVLPLYGALTREDQERVFEPFAGQRKVIVATNIAETSITIDDVRFVIDCGTAKVPRFSARTGILALREEGIPQASADQRLGRAGRTAPGKCIRLYSERDYNTRPRFGDEEIVRLDLSEVVLRLCGLGFSQVEDFAFPTPPTRARLHAALDELLRLGAIDRERNVTGIGKEILRLPLTPQLARCAVEAAMRWPEALDDVLAAVALLSGRSPLQFPQGHEEAARQAHARFAEPMGDVAVMVSLYKAWRAAPDPPAFARKSYVDQHTLAFAQNAHEQLADLAREMGWEVGQGGPYELLARSLTAGFSHQILANRGRFFEGVGDERFYAHPGSVLYAQPPRFAVATELVVSNRAYARQLSPVRPSWIVELRPDLAARWRLKSDRVEERKESPPPTAAVLRPTQIQIGGVWLAIDWRKNKPTLEIPQEAIEQIVLANEQPPQEARRWTASVRVGDLLFGQGTPLQALLQQLPSMALPTPGTKLTCPVPEGALLEVDRNLHTIERHLGDLLAPAQGGQRRPGWVTLVGNGGGGYWFEVITDWREAVETTAISLEALADDLDDDDPVRPEVLARQETVEALARSWETRRR